MEVKRNVRSGDKIGRLVTCNFWVDDSIPNENVESVLLTTAMNVMEGITKVVLADREES